MLYKIERCWQIKTYPFFADESPASFADESAM